MVVSCDIHLILQSTARAAHQLADRYIETETIQPYSTAEQLKKFLGKGLPPSRASDHTPIAETHHSRRRTILPGRPAMTMVAPQDRKSTRLNSSHVEISYAVFCLKKKKKKQNNNKTT